MVRGLPRVWRWVSGIAMLALLGACAAMIEEASRGPAPTAPVGPVSLIATLSLRDGTLVDRLDPGGMTRPGASMALVRLVRPVAIAVRDADLYIADAAMGALYRVDAQTRTFARLPAIPATEGMRLMVGVDRVLHVLDRGSARITRWLPDGRGLPALAVSAIDLGRPVDMAVEEPGGALVLADGLQRQLVWLPPAAGAWRLVSLRAEPALQPRAIERIALGPRQWYLSDPQCACVWLVAPGGQVLGRVAATSSGAVSAIAADAEGRVYVADPIARELKVLVDSQVVQTFSYRSLGVSAIADLRSASGFLWIVDPVGGSVEARRIVARTARGGLP